MWKEVDAIAKPEAYFATNTSSLSVTEQAAVTSRPEHFLGLHFFNPAQVMPLLEVVRAEDTSDDAYQLGFELGEKLRKTTVAARDNRGFIVNRLLVPYLLEAVRLLESGVASREDIDQAPKLGCGHPMGPFTLLDLVGLDTTLYVAEVMFTEFREPRFAPPPLLKRMVMAGHLGRKSGKGFYDYARP
jgi:3-hydroxybutyryl-CoA dehydrogenase